METSLACFLAAVRGLIMHCFPIIDINDAESVKAYVIVNEEEIPIVLRLSKDLLDDHDPNVDTFHKEPLTIISSNLEVKTFHGLSLAAQSNTYFGNFRTTYLVENPPLPEDLGLKKWYADNKEKVLEWVKNKAYEDTNRFFPPPTPERVLDLTTVMLAYQNVKTCWVKAKVKLSVTRAQLCYVVCGNCGMQVEAIADWNLESSADVECSGCSVLSPIQVRLKLPVTLIDENINLRTTLKSPDAEKIFPFAAVEIKKHEDEGLQVVNDISLAMDNTEVVCFVKYSEKLMNDEIVRRYSLLKMYTPDDMDAFNEGTCTPLHTTFCLGPHSPAATPAELMPLPPSSGKATDVERQFFLPSTKSIPEQVAKESNETGASTSAASPVKRAINFGT